MENIEKTINNFLEKKGYSLEYEFDNEQLDYLVSIFNNLNKDYSFETNLIDFLEYRYSNISSVEEERTLLQNPCKTRGGKKKKSKTKTSITTKIPNLLSILLLIILVYLNNFHDILS